MTEIDNFLVNPTYDNLCKLLKENTGELENFDFKQIWQICPKMAKHIIGIANLRKGAIIIGVRQRDDNTFDIIGLQKLYSKDDIEKSLRKFIPNKLKYSIHDFDFGNTYKDTMFAGKKFQSILIEDNHYIPFVSLLDGDEIKKGIVYIRKGTNTEPANYEDIQEIINRRIENECCNPEILELDPNIKFCNYDRKIIKKDVFSDLGDYNAKLLTTDRGTVIIKLYIGEHFIKCIKFASGTHKFEKYALRFEGSTQDQVTVYIGHGYYNNN